MSDLTITSRRFCRSAIAVMETLFDDELKDQNIVYRKLAGQGFPREAVIVLNMDHSDYECFVMNTLADERRLDG